MIHGVPYSFFSQAIFFFLYFSTSFCFQASFALSTLPYFPPYFPPDAVEGLDLAAGSAGGGCGGGGSEVVGGGGGSEAGGAGGGGSEGDGGAEESPDCMVKVGVRDCMNSGHHYSHALMQLVSLVVKGEGPQ